MTATTPLLDLFTRVLDEAGLNWERLAGRSAVRVPPNQDRSAALVVDAREERELVLVYCILAESVPPSRRSAMADLLTRANYGLPAGCFELDFADGEVRLRTELEWHGLQVTEAAARHLLVRNATTFERYLRAIERVARGEATPEAAVREVEG
jgi:hypothetical protein